MSAPLTLHELIQKYDTACPRYTSYPTVPYWEENLSSSNWKKSVQHTFQQSVSKEISLYIHLPFCEALCTYCGCNKRITRNHQVEKPYLDTVLQEWKMYRELLGTAPALAEIHLGGGTPTFFSADHLKYLIESLLQTAAVREDAHFGVEVHPNYTTQKQLQALHDVHFRRLSVGIQDFDERVQRTINRRQTYEQTKRVFDYARAIGYTSINADIIYGLPLQTADSVCMTIEHVQALRPERIAFYSYAHVPWKSQSQRHYTEADLPKAAEKRHLYETGRTMLLEAGYVEIGMDHFALPEDELCRAAMQGTLHRNFMGYTTQSTDLLIGLGASSISDSWHAFMQNSKEIESYQEAVWMGELPILKGHMLTAADLVLRRHISNLMCRSTTSWPDAEDPLLFDAVLRLKSFEADGLVILEPRRITLTETGKIFVRNIALQLDARYWKKQTTGQLFSQSI